MFWLQWFMNDYGWLSGGVSFFLRFFQPIISLFVGVALFSWLNDLLGEKIVEKLFFDKISPILFLALLGAFTFHFQSNVESSLKTTGKYASAEQKQKMAKCIELYRKTNLNAPIDDKTMPAMFKFCDDAEATGKIFDSLKKEGK